MSKLSPLWDIAVASVMFGWLPLVLLDPDGTIWRYQEAANARAAIYAQALVACFRGQAISIDGLLVLCERVEALAEPQGVLTIWRH